VAGLLLAWLQRQGDASGREQALILLATVACTLILFLGYNLTFAQQQGRYLFPALIPAGSGVALGLDAWVRQLGRRSWLNWLLPAGLALALIGLDLLALVRYIIPQLG